MQRQQPPTLFDKIVREPREKQNITQGPYKRSVASESGVCSWDWTNVRQRDINVIARFRYTLPLFFIYFTNEDG